MRDRSSLLRSAEVMSVPQGVVLEAVELAEELASRPGAGSLESCRLEACRKVAGRHRMMPGPILVGMECGLAPGKVR